MKSNEKIKQALIDFIEKEKFSEEEWRNRGLNPSDEFICSKMKAHLNECAEQLVKNLNTKDKNTWKKILKIRLHKIDKNEYDTEEREMICDYFYQLSQIVKVDFTTNLNRWLYGFFLSILIKLFGRKD